MARHSNWLELVSAAVDFHTLSKKRPPAACSDAAFSPGWSRRLDKVTLSGVPSDWNCSLDLHWAMMAARAVCAGGGSRENFDE